MFRKSHKRHALINQTSDYLEKNIRSMFMWIDEKYTSFIQDFFLDDEHAYSETFTTETLAYGTTLEWNLKEVENDPEITVTDHPEGRQGFLTKAKRSFHIYMELDTMDPEEFVPSKATNSLNPCHLEQMDGSNVPGARNIFRVSRWNLIRLYFRNIFKAITNLFRVIRSSVVENLLILRIFIPFTLSGLKIRGPSQRC